MRRSEGHHLRLAILEYLTVDFLELAGASHALPSVHVLTHLLIIATLLKELASSVSYITPRHLPLAIRGDEEFDSLVRVSIAGCGVLPFIHKSLTAGKINRPQGVLA